MSTILSKEDKGVCEGISKGEESIYKKRALALLAIDDGETQVKAADISTLSVGQVRYFLSKYKTLGISCFPSDLIAQKDASEPKEEVTVTKEVETIEETVEKVETKEESKPKKTKKKKKKETPKKEKKEKEPTRKTKKTKKKEKKEVKKPKEEKKEKKKKTKKKEKK